ncbi:hypothetical protein GCM10011376_32020 [Nocardioides flavus (ex Wang et al. 2016)]|uniref:Dolichyl-phosphate-mannose-protein mannosyltransferase n=1 Tax=Nocardioides flavus (ex Wang et al. 2016) TaxID=2058780 RepID=A0ABQ3HPN6_9ACTN|nr:hypothetical protein [Nocardioides flavus (ex Wang et al. 2016)]GHE18592.1 hypothetical protein GCM10011376_32020 [Nocardioides flavus (ex Wang et al. 2016)]
MPARPRVAIIPLLAVVVLGSLLAIIQVLSYPRLSPIDELSHLDYMYRSPTLLDPGDKVGQEAMHTQACRGVDADGFEPQRCRAGTVYDPDIYQENGFNTAATNTPLYYTADRVVAEVIRWVTPADELFVAGRAAGALWLALGVLLTALAGRRLGVRPLPLAAVLGVVVAAPAMTYASATVTPDAMGLAIGAGVLLAALRWEDRPSARGRAALLVVVAALAALVKLTNFVVVAGVALYLLLHRSRGGDEAPTTAGHRNRTVVALVTGGFALFCAGAWTLFSNARSSSDPDDVPDMATRFTVDAFPWRGLIDNALTLVQPLQSPWVAVGDPTLMWFSNGAAHLLITAGLLGAALFLPAGSREALLARCLVVAAVVFSLGLVVLGYVTAHMYFPLPNRYGLALVAPAAVVTASMLRTRTSVIAVSVLALIAVTMSLFRLIGLPWVPPT